MSRYGAVGLHTNELLTYKGRALVHPSKEEMEFILRNVKVVRLTDGLIGQPWMWLKDHPALASYTWPLRKEEFV